MRGLSRRHTQTAGLVRRILCAVWRSRRADGRRDLAHAILRRADRPGIRRLANRIVPPGSRLHQALVRHLLAARGLNRPSLTLLQADGKIPLSKAEHYLASLSPSEKFRHQLEGLSDRPGFSILVPVYNTDPVWLDRMVASVRAQVYPEWELILSDDGSTRVETAEFLRRLEGAPQIRVLFNERNAGISHATNTALAAASGTFIALLDHDDELTQDALLEMACRIDCTPDLDVLYSDEDKINPDGRLGEPFHKPDWSPEMLRNVMYVGHLLVVRRTLALEVGGFDSRFDMVQDFEFMLRLAERTRRIAHLPRILYHWRRIPGSLALATDQKCGITALQAAAVGAHLTRCGVPATCEAHPRLPHRVVLRPRPRDEYPLVSVVIPTRDQPHHLGRCLSSLFGQTTYPNFEVVLVDNQTTDPEALALFKRYPVTVVPFNENFNFSRANNLGVQRARGQYVVLLNNDTEIITRDWIETVVFYLERPDVGAVGLLLLFPDNTVQHAGVVLGMRGTADHVMRGFPADVDGYFGSLSCTREVSAVTGACLATPRALYLESNGLREDYRVHYQDVDYCCRLRHLGRQILFTPHAALYHHESASRGSGYDMADRLLLIDTWMDMIQAGDPFYNPNFSLSHTEFYQVKKDLQ